MRFFFELGVPYTSNMIKPFQIGPDVFVPAFLYWNSSSEESKRVFSLLVTFVEIFGMMDFANPEPPDVLGMVTVV